MATVSAPTGFNRSITSEIQASVLSNNALDAKTKGFIIAALMCVGNQSHGKEYIPEFQHWKVGSAKTFGKGGMGLNCWTALIFWAFQGGALEMDTLIGYMSKLRLQANDDPGTQMQAENEIMYSFLRANQAVKIKESDEPPPGVTIFFGDPGWSRPLNHVVVSLGKGYCVSQQSLFIGVKGSAVNEIIKLNPTLNPDDLVSKALTHVSTIKIIANSNEDKDVSIRVTPKPFWELPVIPWKS